MSASRAEVVMLSGYYHSQFVDCGAVSSNSSKEEKHTFPLHPNLLGVLSDATTKRLESISLIAAEHGRSLGSRQALQRQLIADDLGHPSQSEASAMHQASLITGSAYKDWLERGRWLTTTGNIDDHDLTTGTHYLRLDDFQIVSTGSGEDLHLEGAFVSGQDNPSGRRYYAVTVLLSGNPSPRIPEMS